MESNCQLCGQPIDIIFNNEFDEVYGGCHSFCLEERYNDDQEYYMDSKRERGILGKFTE